jgi:hypothetical protein
MAPRVVRVSLLLSGVLLLALPVRAQTEEPRTAGITGTLTFLGCTPDPEEFTLYGVPMIAQTERPDTATRDVDDDLDLPVIEGVLAATRDPHTLSVILPEVPVGLPHQLRIVAHPPNPCGRIFWEGPAQGIAFAGQEVRLVGYAPQSSIEVLGTQFPGAPRRGWVGADTIDVHGPAAEATRQFRWLTRVPNVTAGLVQVSTEEFPKQNVDGRVSCATAPGVIHERMFPARSGAWNMLPELNLAAIAARASTGPLRAQNHDLFAYGAPLYVRVVPVRGGALVCDSTEHGPLPWVVLANAAKTGERLRLPGGIVPGPEPPSFVGLGASSNYAPPWFWNHPVGKETAYRVVHPHQIPPNIYDTSCCFLPLSPFCMGKLACPMAQDPWAYEFAAKTDLQPGDTIPAGLYVWFKPGSKGFDLGDVFSGFVSIVTGAIDALGFLVTQISNGYNEIKNAVAAVAVSAISATGLVNCEQSNLCQELVQVALNTGLAAMGMPPSLPNWDALVDQGFEYMAAEVVSQAGAGGIPGAQELTKAAAKQLVEEVGRQMNEKRGGGGSLPKWLTLDLGYQPAVLTLMLTTMGKDIDPWFPNRMAISGNAAFLGAIVKIPAKTAWPSTFSSLRALSIPVVLRPNLAGFDPPSDAYGDYYAGLVAKQWHKARLASLSCVTTATQLFIMKTWLSLSPTPYAIPALSFNPNWHTPFPPTVHCMPLPGIG